MAWGEWVGEDGVPDHGLGGRCVWRGCRVGGIGGCYVEEDLFCVVGEEG